MIDYRWNPSGLRTRAMVIFGHCTTSLSPTTPDRDRLIIENTDAASYLRENIASDSADAYLIEFLTDNDGVLTEAEQWVSDNNPDGLNAFTFFHVFAENPHQKGTGLLFKNVAAIFRHQNTAVLFKTFFAGRDIG